MRDGQNVDMREHMLDYVIALLEVTFLWGAEKVSHAALLCRMEQEEIKKILRSGEN